MRTMGTTASAFDPTCAEGGFAPESLGAAWSRANASGVTGGWPNVRWRDWCSSGGFAFATSAGPIYTRRGRVSRVH